MKFKKWAASATAAVLLAAGVTVGGAAVAASAHTAQVHASAVCQDDGTYIVNWTVDADYTNSTVTPQSFVAAPQNATPSKPAKFSQVVPGGTTSLAYSFLVVWVDNWEGTHNVNGTLTDATFKGCAPTIPDTPGSETISICHANEGGGYVSQSPSKWSFYNHGHIDHSGDIFPAGSVVKNGVTYTWAAQGDQSLLGTNCAPPVVVVPTVSFDYSAVCGEITLTTTSTDVNPNWYYGIKASVNGTQIGSAVLKGSGVKTSTIALDEDSHGGSVDVVVETYASTEQDLLPDGWALGEQHVVTVDTDCLPNAVEVTFPEPTPPTCDAGGSLPQTPADTDQVTWAWSGGTLTATAKDGYVIVGESSRTYTDPGAALGYQNTDPQADCYVAPPTKDDTSEVTYGEAECGDTEVDVFTAVTTYTFDFDTRTGTYSEPIPHSADPVKTGTKTVEATECPVPPKDTPKEELAYTGAEIGTGVLGALVLLLAGGVFLIARRRQNV